MRNRTEYSAAYYLANKAKCNASSAAYNKKNYAKIKARKLEYLYGITLAERDALIVAQGGVCAICGLEFDEVILPYVDHSHETGEVRGILCSNCNLALGKLGDSLEGLMRAVRYLGG